MTAVAQTQKMNASQAANEPALLQEWTGPYDGVPPWDQVQVSQFPAAFQAAMAASKAEFEAMLGDLSKSKCVGRDIKRLLRRQRNVSHH